MERLPNIRKQATLRLQTLSVMLRKKLSILQPMLRIKVYAGFALFILLLVIMGAFSISMLGRNARGFEQAVSRNYDAIKIVQTIRYQCSEVDSNYLPRYSSLSGQPLDLTDYEKRRSQITESVTALVELNSSAEEKDSTGAFQKSVTNYLAIYDQVLSSPAESQVEITSAQSQVLSASQMVANSADDLLSLHESAMADQDTRMRNGNRSSRQILGGIILSGTVFALFVSFQFHRSFLRPVEQLIDSARNIQKGQFDQELPIERRDELGHLMAAFNEMASELALIHQQTDERFLHLTLQSQAILAAFPHPIMILDPSGEILQRNPAAETLLRNLGSSDEVPAKIATHVQVAQQTETDYLPEDLNKALLLAQKDREYYYLPRIFRIRLNMDAPPKWGVALIDVTSYRWLDDMQSNLLGTVSHEIKTPLTGIRIVLHMLLEEQTGSLNDTQRKALNSARNDCENLLDTLQRLLNLARSHTGADELEMQAVAPEDLALAGLSEFQPIAERKGTSLESSIDPGLPEVHADATRIRQVFTNLFSNALKYGPDQGTIRLKVTQDSDHYVRFAVGDEGPGIPLESQERLFQRFYRLPDSEHEGTGLGLSICREIVHAHGGQIGVDSPAGGPTTFYFYLPVKDSEPIFPTN